MRGQTGYDFVDAAMREIYVTGKMHNRARMIVASFLTKHLMVHWKVGMDWFADCLVDWDPASNAMGWQWTAGSGPDAAPFSAFTTPRGRSTNSTPTAAIFDAGLPKASAIRPKQRFRSSTPHRWGGPSRRISIVQDP